MEILRALQIARGEWIHIKTSLEMCGDIGKLHYSNNNTRNKSAILVASDGLSLVRNFIEMENKLPIYGYYTPEAAYVFTTFVSKTGKSLDL
jgi:hypothetical protein